MRTIINIVVITVICGAVSLATGLVRPFSLERVSPADDLQRVKDKINRNADKSERKDRESQKWDNEHYPQWDTATTNAGGIDTIYLTDKYETTHYFIGVTGAASTIVNAGPLSDSSFFVTTAAHDGSGLSTSYRWQTTGAKKTSE